MTGFNWNELILYRNITTVNYSTAQNGDTRDDSLLWRNSSGSTAIYDRPHQSDDINIQQFDTQNYKDDSCSCVSALVYLRDSVGLSNGSTANKG